jgi:hypothetical protein
MIHLHEDPLDLQNNTQHGSEVDRYTPRLLQDVLLMTLQLVMLSKIASHYLCILSWEAAVNLVCKATVPDYLETSVLHNKSVLRVQTNNHSLVHMPPLPQLPHLRTNPLNSTQRISYKRGTKQELGSEWMSG